MAHYDHTAADGTRCTTALDKPGFPLLLWDLLQHLGCDTPPRYVTLQRERCEIDRCKATVVIHPNPRGDWDELTFSAKGILHDDAVELVAMDALAWFCTSQRTLVGTAPAALFPRGDGTSPDQASWRATARRSLQAAAQAPEAYLEAMARYSHYLRGLLATQRRAAKEEWDSRKAAFVRERESQEAEDLLSESLQHQCQVNHDLERRLAETEARAQEAAAALQTSDVTLDQTGRALEHRTAALDEANARIAELTAQVQQLTAQRSELQVSHHQLWQDNVDLVLHI